MEKLKTDKVIIVEGKYDKIKLSSILDAHIITTGGFSIFNNKEKCVLIRRLSEKNGIVILTDSDSAGFVIRNKLKGYLSNESKVINLYVPKIPGKEARKSDASKEGYLGVEGIGTEQLRQVFENAGILTSNSNRCVTYSKAELYELGYSGKDDSSLKRDEICKANGLPTGMSANAFLESINLLGIILE